MRAPATQIRKAAVRHFQANELPAAAAELPAALAACAVQLVDRFSLPEKEARDLAWSAYAEVSGNETGCHIDLVRSTKHEIVLVDERAGVRRRIPLIDVVRLLGPRAAA